MTTYDSMAKLHGTVLGGVPVGKMDEHMKPRLELGAPVVMKPNYRDNINGFLDEDKAEGSPPVFDGASRLLGYDAASFFESLGFPDLSKHGSESCGLHLVPYNKDMASPDVSAVFAECGGTAGLLENIPATNPLRDLRTDDNLGDALEVLFTYHQYKNPVFVASVVGWAVVDDIEVCFPVLLNDNQQQALWTAAQEAVTRIARGDDYPGPGPNGLSVFLEKVSTKF